METLSASAFERNYRLHLQHLKLKGLQPKTIDAYARAIRRIGERFDHQIEELSAQQLTDYFTELLGTHSWSAVKLDLYGLKFYYAHVLRRPWVAPGLIKPPKTQRLPDIVTIAEAKRLFERARKVLPGGVPSSYQVRDPWPIYLERGIIAAAEIEGGTKSL